MKDRISSLPSQLLHPYQIILLSKAWFPPFRCHSSIAVSPLPLANAISVHRCCMPWLVGIDDWLASYIMEQRKNRTRSYFNGRTVMAAFYRLQLLRNGIFLRNFYGTTEFYNAEWRNGKGRTATERWKPGTTEACVNNLPKIAACRRRVWDSKQQAVDCKSDALTTTPPSHRNALNLLSTVPWAPASQYTVRARKVSISDLL